MEKEKLNELVNKFLSQREIAKELNCSQSTVKYWLKKYSLKTINKIKNEHINIADNEKYCSMCDTIKLKDEFYKINKNSEKLQSKCKKCNHKLVGKRFKLIKIKMLEYKGNQCVDCGLHVKDTYPCVFDFHHLDPNEKDKDYYSLRNKKWDEITLELDKCVILCSNCHRIRHSDLD
jgi:predicted transcriptional regulator